MESIKDLYTPISEDDIASLKVGDIIRLHGYIYTGRDAVLPKVVKCIDDGSLEQKNIDLKGMVMFHTAVSPAGVGPTSSNKKEIEESFGPLSAAGIKIHLGKGEIQKSTIDKLKNCNSIFAVIPPTTALFQDQIQETQIVGWPELGMEALHKIKIDGFQAIVGAANGESIYDK